MKRRHLYGLSALAALTVAATTAHAQKSAAQPCYVPLDVSLGDKALPSDENRRLKAKAEAAQKACDDRYEKLHDNLGDQPVESKRPPESGRQRRHPALDHF